MHVQWIRASRTLLPLSLPSSSASLSWEASSSPAMSSLPMEFSDEDSSSLLELAANNDLDGFKNMVDRDPTVVDAIGLWYGRKKGSNQMVLQQRTPLMVAATYGSLDVLGLIVSLSLADVNLCCGSDKTTALHCAASGGSVNAVDAVKVLLSVGADPKLADGNGHRPADVILVSPGLLDAKIALEELLGRPVGAQSLPQTLNLRVLTSMSGSNSPPLSSSPDGSPSSDSVPTPTMGKLQEPVCQPGPSEKREYPADPTLPDIKNSIYTTDEFRMFSFKIRPCSRAYSHDWTECPFAHPGENARRRDPRKVHYSCMPCSEFRKGACRKGDSCEYAHGVFECWLHPAQYRTRLCKDGTSCNRRVCFFAHTSEELRPLIPSTGSAMSSPRSAAAELAALAMGFLPGSPSSLAAMSPSPFTPPMSPSANSSNVNLHHSLAWPQMNLPALNIPGSNLQSSRLRSSFNARDLPFDDAMMLADFDAQQQLYANTNLVSPAVNRPGRLNTLSPSNLDELFSAEVACSPRFNADHGAMFSPTHKSVILNQLIQQQQQQNLLSPMTTAGLYSPRAIDPQQLPMHTVLMQATMGFSSPGLVSPHCMETQSPMNSHLAALAQRERQQLRSLSSRELGSGMRGMIGGSPSGSLLSNWASPSGKLDWGVNGEEIGRLRRSNSFELFSGGEEPDVSWVQSLVSPQEMKEANGAIPTNHFAMPATIAGEGSSSDTRKEAVDHAMLGAWLDNLQLDRPSN